MSILLGKNHQINEKKLDKNGFVISNVGRMENSFQRIQHYTYAQSILENVQDPLQEVFLQKSSGEYYKLPEIPKLSKNIAGIEKLDKEEAIKSNRHRIDIETTSCIYLEGD